MSYAAPLAISSFDEAKIAMYPNPVSSSLSINSLENIDAISIYNVIGQEVMNLKVNDANVVINVSGFQNGIYIVKAFSEGKVSTSKFIKE